MAASSAAIVVGKVARRSARSRRDFLDPSLEDRIVGFDGDGEPAICLSVFMAAVDLGLAGKGGELGQRAPHDRKRRLEHAAATKGKQRVAAEGHCVVLEMISDMTERVAGGFDDFRSQGSDLGRVPLLHLAIEERDSRRVLGRTPYFRVWEFCPDVRNALDVIGVMMGDQDVGQIPAPLRQGCERGPCFRNVDAGRRPGRLIVDQGAVIVGEAEILMNAHRHGAWLGDFRLR